MKYTRVLFLVFLLAKATTAEKPRCSKYDFEEKVLEKIVTMEFYEKQYKTDLERMKSDIEQKLEEIESLNSVVNNAVKEFDSKVTETITALTDNASSVLADITQKASATTTALEQKFAILEKDVTDKLETKQGTIQPVVFKARLSSNIVAIDGYPIIYPKVLLNTGDGYDSSSGIFTVPVNGTYMFDIVLCPYDNKYINVAIGTENGHYTLATFYGNDGYTCYSANAVAVLRTGQKVRVMVMTNTSVDLKLAQDDYRWNTFSGVLVHE